MLQGGGGESGGGGEMKTDLIMITFEARHGNLTWFITLLSLLSRTLENFTTKLKKKKNAVKEWKTLTKK